VSIARAELILLVRNRTVAALAIPLPVLLGVYVIWQQNPQTPQEWLHPILLQLVFVLLVNVFSTVTLTVVSRRQSLMLKRLRTSELRDGVLIAGVATPAVLIAIVQLSALQALNASAGAPMPANFPLYLLALVGGLGVEPLDRAFTGAHLSALLGASRQAVKRVLMDQRRGGGAHRLKCETGPAIAWPDGWGVYAVHGVRVPARIIERPESITHGEITSEKNAEIRRVMMERYGLDRYLADCGAKPIHADEYGELYRMPGMTLPLVRVVNSTPEPDGTSNIYVLTAAREDCRTAHDAVASTFGLTADQYQPAVET
jgi:hypothetical protein